MSFIKPKSITAQEYVATNLRVPTFIPRIVEVMNSDGERETINCRVKLLPKSELLIIKANAAVKARDMIKEIPKDSGSLTSKEAEDDVLGELMTNECVFRSFYNEENDQKIFPTLESVAEVSIGNVGSFAKHFWDVQALFSVSRAVLSEEEMKEYDDWIMSGVDADFFYLSLSTKGAIMDFMRFLVSQRRKAQQPSIPSTSVSKDISEE